MKLTAVISIVLCFVFILSLALVGCRKNNDPYFMNSSEYDSLISGIAGGNNSNETGSNENSGEITNPPVPDEDGDEIDNSSTVTPSKKPSSSSKKPTSSKEPTATSSKKPTSSKEPTSTSSKKPESSSSKKEESSSEKPSSSSNPAPSSSNPAPSSSKPSSSSSTPNSSSSKKPSGSISVGSKPGGAIDWIV